MSEFEPRERPEKVSLRFQRAYLSNFVALSTLRKTRVYQPLGSPGIPAGRRAGAY
jgi:hypothetical protein